MLDLRPNPRSATPLIYRDSQSALLAIDQDLLVKSNQTCPTVEGAEGESLRQQIYHFVSVLGSETPISVCTLRAREDIIRVGRSRRNRTPYNVRQHNKNPTAAFVLFVRDRNRIVLGGIATYLFGLQEFL